MMRKKISLTPDAQAHAPTSAITPEQIAESQRNIAALIDSGASVEAIHKAEEAH